MMTDRTLTFIGGGNMARSLVGGLISGGWPANRIRVADPDMEQSRRLGEEFSGIMTTQSNADAAMNSDIILFAVKPQVLEQAALELAPLLQASRPLIISIAAGIRSETLQVWLGMQQSIVRCMPNTPALVKTGATGLFANQYVTTEQQQLAETILQAVGITLWVEDEDAMDAITALSGSGPAYFLLVMEAIEQAGVKLGLSQQDARQLTLQTALGSALLAQQSGEDPAALRKRVTSPGGTTERGIQQLESGNLRQIFALALEAAAARSRELAKQTEH